MESKPYAITDVDWKLQEMRGLFRSIKADLWTPRTRYHIIESFLRNVPGSTGQYLRYRFLGRHFRKVGSNVLIFEGIRIREPEELTVGSNVAMGMDCTLDCGGSLEIGNNVLMGPGVKIWTVSHVFADESRPICQQGLVHKPVVIGADCWLCADCFINPGTVLPEGCIVLPKAVVGRMRIAPYSVLGGNPAKFLGLRGKLGLFIGATNRALE